MVTLSSDENMNSELESSQMDVQLMFWDAFTVHSRYFSSLFSCVIIHQNRSMRSLKLYFKAITVVYGWPKLTTQ